jgi:RecA/RadA recombinase
LSGHTEGGWARGRAHNIVGDRSSGKTVLALEEAFWFFNNIQKIKSKVFKPVKHFDIIYDIGEGVMDFPIRKMYGEEFQKKVQWIRSRNFEQMCRSYIKKMSALRSGHALLYVVDSWDSFMSAKSQTEFIKSVDNDTDLKGDYDLAVQKYASKKFFPTICERMDRNKTDATLCIISQTRANIGVTFGKKMTRSGGKALDFYTHQVLWLREVEKKNKKKLGESRVYAIRCEGQVERSKVAKPFRQAEFTILFDYGLSDLDSMLDYVYGPKASSYSFQGQSFKDRLSIIAHIEDKGLEDVLKRKVERKWTNVEKAFVKEVEARKPRF